MMFYSLIASYLPLIIPVLLIELGMKVYAILDIHKRERETVGIGKTGWTVVIALITLGWLPYLLVGRKP